MRRARTYPWTRTRQSHALSRKLAASFPAPFWAVCITNTSGFDLRQAQLSYMKYHNEVRTHLSLEKDAPVSRAVERAGRILCRPILSDERALKADPNHVKTWQYYGLWQVEQGNRDQAQYHLNRIAELAGTD